MNAHITLTGGRAPPRRKSSPGAESCSHDVAQAPRVRVRQAGRSATAGTRALTAVDFGLLDPVPQPLRIDAQLLSIASVGSGPDGYVAADFNGHPRGPLPQLRRIFRFRWQGIHLSGCSMSPSVTVRFTTG